MTDISRPADRRRFRAPPTTRARRTTRHCSRGPSSTSCSTSAARCRSRRRATTGMSRSPMPCAIGCWTSGFAPRGRYAEGRPRRRVPVGRVPHRAAPRQQRREPRHRGGGPGGHRSARPELRRARRGGRQSRASATAASAGSPPAFSIRWRRSRSPPSATAFATSSASSISRFATAGRSSSPTSGWRRAIRGRFARRGGVHGRASAAAPRRGPTRRAGVGSAGFPHASSRGSRSTRPSSAIASTTSTCCVSGRRRRPSRSTSPRSTSATTTARSTQKVVSENLTKVLYPNDDAVKGKRLRLEQQYFFVSCSLQDMIRLHLDSGGALTDFDRGFVAQLNDTHPSIAVAELMRLLVDEHAIDWDAAWAVTQRTLSYTNHTLLPEALERGRCRCSPTSCRGTWRSSSRSTGGSSTRCAGVIRATRRSSRACRSSARRATRPCGWRTSRASAATTSTACRRCTRELLEARRAPRLPRALAREVRQRDQRRDAAALGALSNPALAALITEAIGDGWIRDPRACGGSSRRPTTRRSASAGAR